MLVIPSTVPHVGKVAHDLAVETGAAVLVARPCRGVRVVVAATDLAHPLFPVLRTGATLAKNLAAETVFVHNLAPALDITPLGPSLAAVCQIHFENAMAARLEQLRSIAAQLGVECAAVVVDRPAATDAILSVLGEQRADLVVVGARRRSRLSRLLSSSIAANVVDDCTCSALVVPIDQSQRPPLTSGVDG